MKNDRNFKTEKKAEARAAEVQEALEAAFEQQWEIRTIRKIEPPVWTFSLSHECFTLFEMCEDIGFCCRLDNGQHPVADFYGSTPEEAFERAWEFADDQRQQEGKSTAELTELTREAMADDEITLAMAKAADDKLRAKYPDLNEAELAAVGQALLWSRGGEIVDLPE